MNELMEQRWRTGGQPFDGYTVQSPPLRVDDLRTGLAAVVKSVLSLTDGELVTFLDWHQHDGYLTRSEVVDATVLADAISSSESLIASSSDDTHVRRAWYPRPETFLLRWCVSSDPDDFGLPPGGPAGDFDLTGSAEMIDAVCALIPKAQITPAKPYFDRSWAG